jgi:energy-coupling factor transporter ATP-binding protein EcfA2
MADRDNKLHLPRLVRACFRHFTLYDLEPEIEIQFPEGIFCLAGANGLGKSTFLLAINYAITGRVPEPDRDFISLEDYYNKTEDFSRSFFDGRIGEADREIAEIEIELRIQDWRVCCRRGMFEPEGLRALSVQDNRGKFRDVEGSASDLNARYQKELTERTGLASFEQLVFLQHFVVTFDERRHLLFWKPRELEQTLHLSFGVDSETAKRADDLRDKAQKADSYGRNAGWQASVTRKKLKELGQAASSTKKDQLDDVEAAYNRLQAESDETIKLADKTELALRDANLQFAELSVTQTTLRAEYDSEFSKRLAKAGDIRYHPIIKRSIAEGRCQLCDAHGAAVPNAIEKRLQSGHCPICSTKLTGHATSKSLGRLKELDKKLGAAAKAVTNAMKRVERLKSEFDQAMRRRDSAVEAFERFTSKNRKEIARLQASGSSGIQAILDEYRRQIENLEREKRRRYLERNEYRAQLRPIQQLLEKQYRNAEHVFVPIFRELAQSFLGVELNVVFELSKSSGANLILDVQRDERREYHQLSESQRFFVDIALRMALIKYMSANEDPGCLYLDTPEGSLDIAYETRAGRMIAQFVKNGFGCVMTANINTSRLLISLAEDCGSQHMVLHRMTTWAELTEVQTAEEELFDDAFAKIEKTLMAKRKR